MAKKIKNYLEQIDNRLLAKKKCKLVINLIDYEIGENFILNEQEGNIKVDGLISRIEFFDISFDLILDYPVYIFVKNMKNVDNEYIEISYEENDVILEATTETRDLKKEVLYTKRLLSGKELVKDISHLYRKVLNIYAPLDSGQDSVHYEILISNILRDKNNPSFPARLGKTWNPTMLNIKKIVFSQGFLHGLAYENIGNALTEGLIQEQDLPPSILEKVLTGKIIEEEK